MKKIILSLALITGSLTAFGQTVELVEEEAMTAIVVSNDLSGIDVVDVVTGAMYRVSTETPVNVGEIVEVVILGGLGGGTQVFTGSGPTFLRQNVEG